MIRQNLYSELLKRIREKRGFMQVLAGPRQTGKTTLVRQVMEASKTSSHYTSADEPTLRDRTWLEQQWDVARLQTRERKAGAVLALDEIQKVLENAGSSMNKVLKCSVFLNDIKDWKAMNEVFQGRFGEEPPVRTTIAAAGGIPGDSLVEMDVIAYI